MHVFVHIGTHKTGTTSLQAFLRERAADLAAEGICVPEAGSLSASSGHHNLAFELSGDPRHDPSQGGVNELIDELRQAARSWQPRCAVISSEVFCCLVEKPQGVSRLESALRREGHTLSWVMFLRRVDDYSESLYTTLWGCGVRPRFGYPGFVVAILLRGKYSQIQRFGGTTYYFDLVAFSRRWRRLSASPLVLRSYDEAVSGEGLLPCFLNILEAPDHLVDTAGRGQPHLNHRIEHVTRRYRRWLRPLLMTRYHRSNLSLIHGSMANRVPQRFDPYPASPVDASLHSHR